MGNLLRSAAGALLLAAALALALPGVSVKADPAPDAPATKAPMCRANAPVADPAEVERVIEVVRSHRSQPDPSIHVLNGAGYNYAGNHKVDLSTLERDISLRRAAQH